MFGYTIIKKDQLKRLKENEIRIMQLDHYHYWFSGWPAVFKLLNQFSLGQVYNTSVYSIRSEFAKAMETDDWGNRIQKEPASE